jgi:hypothetical protein
MPGGIDEEYEADEYSRSLYPRVHLVSNNSEWRDTDISYESDVPLRRITMQLSFIIGVLLDFQWIADMAE